jgi:alpha-galactosidase
MQILDKQEGLRQYAGPGHWNDPDMLEVGNGALTPGEDRAHFSMWAMLAAPLIAGNDLRNMSKETIEVLTNKEVIAVNQDSLGVQGFKYSVNDSVETWFKPLKNGDWAVGFLNRNKAKPVEINFDWQEQVIIDTLSKAVLDAKQITFKIRNLWTKKDAGNTKKPLKAIVPPHDILMLRLKR